MGLFDAWFGTGKARVRMEDRIWLHQQAKLTGVAQEANAIKRADAIAVLMVAHFPDVLEQLHKTMDQQILDVPSLAVLASELDANLAATLKLDPSTTLEIITAERHPLAEVDDQLTLFAEELPCQCRIVQHLSLDDPVITLFAGDSMQNLLRQFGIDESEPIVSPLVIRRLRRAQQKIKRKQSSNHAANSSGEWIEKNCPTLQPVS